MDRCVQSDAPVEGKLSKKGSRQVRTERLRLAGIAVAALAASAAAAAQNSSIFGPNVYVFTPSMSASSISSTLSGLAGNSQFSTNRYAVLFMPGTYSGVESEVGYYESIAGLGQTPSAVAIDNGFLEANQSGGNSTLIFWRSLENMSITPPSGSTLYWGVSQGIAFRRMQVTGKMQLTTSSCGFGSGGFISDTVITGTLDSCDQQQWYTRNSSIGGWSGGSFNMVFSGVEGAPAQSFPSPPYTTLAETPVSRERPFLYVDSGGNYWVFSPALRNNSSGTSWSGGGMGPGSSLPISSFFIATPSSTLAQINSALASGKNLILTPGIYKYSGSINVVNPNTVVLGLGYATLVPQSGTAAITVADVDGVQLAGLLIDAGPVNSPVLLQVGVAGGSRVSHQSDPTSLNDVFFRVGGATAGMATTCLEVDSDNVILDDSWIWRADHGTGVGWTSNVSDHGLVVNGDDVTALGLAVEHHEQNQVIWNGERGETIFYQSELPYDVPSESAWMDNGVDGYASYAVSDSVTSHLAYGLGVYSLFHNAGIVETSGITVPNVAGVLITDALSWFIGDNGSITHVVDNAGAAVNSGNHVSDLTSYGSAAPSCTAAPSTPANLAATDVSASAINLTWSASTAGSSCSIAYNVYRSTTNGFTPSTSNQIASGTAGASYSDTGLSAATTYYYLVEAVDSAGSSAASNQASATTSSNGGGGGGTCTVLCIDSGSTTAVSPFAADEDFSGGSTINHANTINTSNVTNPAPESVYQSARDATTQASGVGAPFSYTIPGLTAGASYTVRLHFAETFFTTKGSRVFDVSINGTQVLTNFDIVAASGGENIANIQQFTATANASGQLVIAFTSVTNNALISGIEIDSTTPPPPPSIEINSGGPAVSPFAADEDFSGGSTIDHANTINTSKVTNPAPQAVYQTARVGATQASGVGAPFTYTIPGLASGSTHTVRLHFAETFFTTTGSRVFNVSINGTQVLTNFDIVAASGGENIANIQQFTATANASGQIVITFTSVTNNALISGIEID
jgi:Malectin domain/Fibronectin type III domain